MFDYPRDLKYLDRTERRVPVITPEMRWMYAFHKIFGGMLLKRTGGKEEIYPFHILPEVHDDDDVCPTYEFCRDFFKIILN
jgi:hypothetical protein